MQTQNSTRVMNTRDVFIVTLLTAVGFFAFSYHIGDIPPYHNDENFYVESAKNMVESGDYITPTYHDKKRFSKPIFFYWLVALFYKSFGINLVSARLVSVVFGTLCIPLTWLLARRLFGRQAALLTAFILPGLYLHFQISRWAITDMVLNFFILLAFFFFIKGYQDKTTRKVNYLLFYLSMALGFMTKGPPAVIVPMITVAAFLLLTTDWSMAKQMLLLPGSLIILALNLPWFLIMLNLHGEEFKNHILGAEIKDRIFHEIPFTFYYAGVLIRYYLPWSLFFISALFFHMGFASSSTPGSGSMTAYFSALPRNMKTAWPRFFHKENRPVLFCFLWVIIPLLLFTLFRIEHSRYMLPASPAIAMILGHFFTTLCQSPGGLRRPLFTIPLVLSLILFSLIILLLGAATLIFNSAEAVPFRIMVFPVYLAFGTGVLYLMFRFYLTAKAIIFLSVFQILTLAALSGDTIPFFNRYPMKAFAHEILKSGNNEWVGVYRLGNHRARLGVLTGNIVVDLYNQVELEAFLNTEKPVFVVIREAVWKEQFQYLPLNHHSSDRVWKKRRVDKETLKQIWNQETPLHLPDLLDNLVLLTNR